MALQTYSKEDILLLMKIILFAFFIVLSSTVSAKILECPRVNDYQELLEKEQDNWCNSNRFSESANKLFELEVTKFQEDNLLPLLQDNTHDVKWLVRKSTQDMREHAFCFEFICRTLQTECADNKQYTADSEEEVWCNTRAKEFGKIEQRKVKESVIANQKRKSQSNLREKMRAIEVRTLKLFIPQLGKFLAEYRFFTIKAPTFLSKPL